MQRNKKILAIGHSVLDKIHAGGKTETKPGGIYFSVLGFIASEFPSEVSLLTTFAKENEKYFAEAYSQVKLIPGYVSGQMPVNHLYIYENKERDEIYEYIPEALDIARAGNLNNYNAIYLNMISGFDVTLDALKEMREKFDGIIYLDIHTLSRGVYKNNKRKFRTIPDGMKWIAQADFVQTNERELKTLSDEFTENEIVREFFEKGGKGFIVTQGKKGAKGYYEKNGEIEMLELKNEISFGNQCVGCGDYFGASFISAYLHARDFVTALEHANKKAGEFAFG